MVVWWAFSLVISWIYAVYQGKKGLTLQWPPRVWILFFLYAVLVTACFHVAGLVSLAKIFFCLFLSYGMMYQYRPFSLSLYWFLPLWCVWLLQMVYPSWNAPTGTYKQALSFMGLWLAVQPLSGLTVVYTLFLLVLSLYFQARLVFIAAVLVLGMKIMYKFVSFTWWKRGIFALSTLFLSAWSWYGFLPEMPGKTLHYRGMIWKKMVTQLNFWGHGWDSSREFLAQVFPMVATAVVDYPVTPVHPHHHVLELFYELGVLGGGFIIFYVMRMFRCITSEIWGSFFLCSCVLCSGGYSIKHVWWISGMVLIALHTYRKNNTVLEHKKYLVK